MYKLTMLNGTQYKVLEVLGTIDGGPGEVLAKIMANKYGPITILDEGAKHRYVSINPNHVTSVEVVK